MRDIPYISIQISALCCYIFLFLSFLSNGKSKVISCFRTMLLACVMWTGGAVLMRLQVYPGIPFWFHISIMGLLFIPVTVYAFLFLLLGIQKSWFLKLVAGASVVLGFLNIGWQVIIPPPEVIVDSMQQIRYLYHMHLGAVFFTVIETIGAVYVLVQVIHSVGKDREKRKKVLPVLLGVALLFAGHLLTLIPNNTIPYDAIGGFFMAICMAFILYREYVFKISDQMLAGIVYSMAGIAVFVPIWDFTKQVTKHFSPDNTFQSQELLFVTILLTLWEVLVIYLAGLLVNRHLAKKQQKKLRAISKFRDDIASIFFEPELYEKIRDALKSVLGAEEVQIVQKECGEPAGKDKWTGLLHYDDVVCGYVKICFSDRRKLNYMEQEYFQQICSYASICIKNIRTYQTVYQISIHDELTGLYNRSYAQKLLEEKWDPEIEQAIVYMDIVDFRLFNELYGLLCADEILKWCGAKILETVGSQGDCARYGSNEFLLFFQGKTMEEVAQLTVQICEAVGAGDETRPKILQKISFSVGVSFYPDMADNVHTLLKQAQKATFFAKSNGKGRIEIYNETLEQQENEQVESHAYEQIAPTVYALMAAIDAKDSYTFTHSCNVSQYAVILAEAIGLPKKEQQIIKESGLLHDIGKIGIPEHILTKKGKLTTEEYEIMKNHVVMSIEMIHFLPNMSYVIPAVMTHHERYDGTGYPRGLKGKEIPLEGRCLAICDGFDAMISKRAYKPEMPIEYGIEELKRNSGTQFDPELAAVFIKLIEEGKLHTEY